jgi:ribosomal protein S19
VLYGLAQISHLAGNVGYIDLRGFANVTEDSTRVLDAAMDAVASSDAIVLDLRKNGGGDPKMVARVLSHVLPPNTHLIDFIGKDGEIQTSTSTVKLPTATIGVPIYALTSAQTFSGGEECAYDLQTLKRATLVGAVTGGGANPGGTIRIDSHFGIFVPDARPRSPVTMTNWEGTGVTPDVAIPAERALATAYGMALDAKLHGAAVSDNLRKSLTATRTRLDSLADADLLANFGKPVSIATWPAQVPVLPELLSEYAGVYQGTPPIPFVITVEGDHLGSKLGDQIVVPIYPESDVRFFAKLVNAEIQFFRDPATHAITHMTLYQNGRANDFTRLPASN